MCCRVDRTWCGLLILAAILLADLGCGAEGERPASRKEQPRKAATQQPAESKGKKGPENSITQQPVKGKRVDLGPNVWLEIMPDKTRRVLISSRVCLRQEMPLEGLLTRKGAKEHEYILAADIDARHIHTGLTLAGAKPGSPVQFAPEYKPAHGTTIKVSVQYTKGNETVTARAQEWICDAKKKPLDKDWVFAGSRLVPDYDPSKPPRYIANYGDIICTRNMEDAALDLSIPTFTMREENRVYQPNTEYIPEKGTVVVVILEPVLPRKK